MNLRNRRKLLELRSCSFSNIAAITVSKGKLPAKSGKNQDRKYTPDILRNFRTITPSISTAVKKEKMMSSINTMSTARLEISMSLIEPFESARNAMPYGTENEQ